jgi:hypothetical protein
MFKRPERPVEPVPIADDPQVQVVFADETLGALVRHSAVHFTFAASRIGYGASSNELQRLVVARIVMPASTLASLLQLVGHLVDQMNEQNAPPAPRVIQ